MTKIMSGLDLPKVIDEEIHQHKKRSKPISITLTKEGEDYVGSLPFKITEGEYVLSSEGMKDTTVDVAVDGHKVIVKDLESDKEHLPAFLAKDEVSILLATKNALKQNYFNHDPAFIIGPPGTGKTKVITRIVEEAIKNQLKVLILSPTNMAVENVVERIDCERLGLQHGDLILDIRSTRESLQSLSPGAIKESREMPLVDQIHICEQALSEAHRTVRDKQPALNMAENRLEGFGIVRQNLQRDLKQMIDRRKAMVNESEGIAKRINSLENSSFIASLINSLSGEGKIVELGLKKEELERSIAKLSREIQERESKLDEALMEHTECKFELEKAEASIKQAKEQIDLVTEKLNELKSELEKVRSAGAYLDAKIVGTTLTKAALNQKIQSCEFDLILVDEASMAVMPSLVAACQSVKKKEPEDIAFAYDEEFTPAQNKAIELSLSNRITMIGDPMQLSPIAHTPDMKRSIFQYYGVDGLFKGHVVHNTVLLDTNYRNHPEIVKMVSDMYYGGLLKSGKPDMKGRALFTKQTNSRMIMVEGSYVNHINMLKVVEQVDLALKKGRRSIGIVTPYNGQAKLINENLVALAEEYPDADIQAGTIHKFQGKEKDIIIFDICYSPEKEDAKLPLAYDGGIDSEVARLTNVATTRAETFFIVIGDINGIMNLKDDEQMLKIWVQGIVATKNKNP